MPVGSSSQAGERYRFRASMPSRRWHLAGWSAMQPRMLPSCTSVPPDDHRRGAQEQHAIPFIDLGVRTVEVWLTSGFRSLGRVDHRLFISSAEILLASHARSNFPTRRSQVGTMRGSGDSSGRYSARRLESPFSSSGTMTCGTKFSIPTPAAISQSRPTETGQFGISNDPRLFSGV